MAPRRGTKTRGFWRPDQNTRFLLRTRKNTTGAEAAHEPARRERLWRTKMSCFYVDARSKMLPCVPARGRPPPRTCFYVGGLCRPEGLPLVFLRTGDRNSAQIGTRGALAARGDRSDPDSDRFVLNRGRPHVKTRVGAVRGRKRRHVKTRPGRRPPTSRHAREHLGAGMMKIARCSRACRLVGGLRPGRVFTGGRFQAKRSPLVFLRLDPLGLSRSRGRLEKKNSQS